MKFQVEKFYLGYVKDVPEGHQPAGHIDLPIDEMLGKFNIKIHEDKPIGYISAWVKISMKFLIFRPKIEFKRIVKITL